MKVVVALLLLSWAWAMLRPLVPVLVFAGVGFVAIRVAVKRWRY